MGWSRNGQKSSGREFIGARMETSPRGKYSSRTTMIHVWAFPAQVKENIRNEIPFDLAWKHHKRYFDLISIISCSDLKYLIIECPNLFSFQLGAGCEQLEPSQPRISIVGLQQAVCWFAGGRIQHCRRLPNAHQGEDKQSVEMCLRCCCRLCVFDLNMNAPFYSLRVSTFFSRPFYVFAYCQNCSHL